MKLDRNLQNLVLTDLCFGLDSTPNLICQAERIFELFCSYIDGYYYKLELLVRDL